MLECRRDFAGPSCQGTLDPFVAPPQAAGSPRGRILRASRQRSHRSLRWGAPISSYRASGPKDKASDDIAPISGMALAVRPAREEGPHLPTARAPGTPRDRIGWAIIALWTDAVR